MDGVPGQGAGQIEPGQRTVYEFDAQPAGLHLYHCHVRPLAEHIAKGLYGAFIVDPEDGREEADEMVMVMNGFDTNFDRANEVYAANTIGFAYMDTPIATPKDELVRVYLVNVLEYDLINSFHLHGNLFHYFPTGTSQDPGGVHRHRDALPGPARDPRVALPPPREVHVPRASVRVHRARLAGLLRGRRVSDHAATERELQGERSSGLPAWLLGLIPLVLIIVAIGSFALLDGPGLAERTGPPAEELAVERTVLEPGVIALTVRNDGPDEVVGGPGDRQRRVRAVHRRRRADRPARDRHRHGSASRGSRARPTRSRSSPRAAARSCTRSRSRSRRRRPDLSFFGLMALLGIYVGVIPVALGMLWLPWIRRIPPSWLRVIMAVTVGLLAYLGIDAVLEGFELAGEGSQAFGGATLVLVGAVVAFLALTGVTEWLRDRRRRARSAGASGAQLALLVAVGIGLHNLGEGVAIGAAYSVGALALGAFLVVGFALHNTTEGLAIVAPLANGRPSPARLAALGLIAGAPAVLGAWIGAAAFNASLAAFLFGFGAGAIAQVIVQLAPSLRDGEGRTLHPPAVLGLLGGMGLMFATGLLVAV